MYCVFSLEKTSKSRVQIVVNMDKTWRGPSSFVRGGCMDGWRRPIRSISNLMRAFKPISNDEEEEDDGLDAEDNNNIM